MVFEAHCMSFPCTELLLFNYAKVNTVFHSMAPLKINLHLQSRKKKVFHPSTLTVLTGQKLSRSSKENGTIKYVHLLTTQFWSWPYFN